MTKVDNIVVSSVDHQSWAFDFGDLFDGWECVTAPGSLNSTTRHSETAHQWGMENKSGKVWIAASQIYAGNGANGLAVENDLVFLDIVPGFEFVEGGGNISIEVLFGWASSRTTVT